MSTQKEDQLSSSTLPQPLSADPFPYPSEHISLIGLGAIGISFLALHLTYTSATVSVFDPRPDLQEHIGNILPLYLPPGMSIPDLFSSQRLKICEDLAEAVSAATIVQEQGPENLGFKQKTWSEVLRYVSPTTH